MTGVFKGVRFTGRTLRKNPLQEKPGGDDGEIRLSPGGNSGQTPSMMSGPDPAPITRRARLLRGLARLSLLLFAAGLLVRLTVRDRFLVANTLFYATPGLSWP